MLLFVTTFSDKL